MGDPRGGESGPQRTQIPDLIGQSPRAAEINVRGEDWSCVVATANVAEADADEIVAQSPLATASGFISLASAYCGGPEGTLTILDAEFYRQDLNEAATGGRGRIQAGEITDYVLPNTAGEPGRAASIASSPLVVKQRPAVGEKSPQELRSRSRSHVRFFPAPRQKTIAWMNAGSVCRNGATQTGNIWPY